MPPVTTNDFLCHIHFYFRLACFTYFSPLAGVDKLFYFTHPCISHRRNGYKRSAVSSESDGLTALQVDSLHSEESIRYSTYCLSYFCLIMCHITGTINVHNWLSISSNDRHEINMDVAAVSKCRLVYIHPNSPLPFTKF